MVISHYNTFAVGDGDWVVHNQDEIWDYVDSRGYRSFPITSVHQVSPRPWQYTTVYEGPQFGSLTPQDIQTGRLPASFNTYYMDRTGRVLPRFEVALPINAAYAGQNFRVRGTQYGVDFDLMGFPIFEPYALHAVSINMRGNMTSDYINANRELAGRLGIDVSGLSDTSLRYWYREQFGDVVWHHVQDATTMLLLPRDIHETVRHHGGQAVCG